MSGELGAAKMSDEGTQAITRVLHAIDRGESSAPGELLPLVYEELRKLAEARMAREPAGMTLQPTALVHEAYMRLLSETGAQWKNRAHFFSAAAEAMRRILIERARRRGRVRHGGGRQRLCIDDLDVACDAEDSSVDLVALDRVLNRLAGHDRRLAEVVNLRFFAGLTVEQVSDVLDISPRTVKRDWEFARAWLSAALEEPTEDATS